MKKPFICTYEYVGQETEGNLCFFEKFFCSAEDKVEALFKYHVWLSVRTPRMNLFWRSLEDYRKFEYAAGGWGYSAHELVDTGDFIYNDNDAWWHATYSKYEQ